MKWKRLSTLLCVVHSVWPAGGNVFAEWSKYDLVISLDSPRCRHPVWPDGGSVFAELDISLYDPCLCVCRQLLAFNPAVHRTASGEGEKCIPFHHTSD